MKTNDVKKPQKNEEEKGLTVEQKRRMAKESIGAIKAAMDKYGKQRPA
jgi:hypothetical protein